MDLDTWGVLAPIEVAVDWAGVRHQVRYHLLNMREEQDVITLRNKILSEHQPTEEGLIRLAKSIVTIDDVSFDEKYPEFENKIEYLATRDSSLTDLLGAGYTVALFAPTKAIEEAENDPNFMRGHANDGFSNVTASTTTDVN